MKRLSFCFRSALHLFLEYVIVLPTLCLLVRLLPLPREMFLPAAGLLCGMIGILFRRPGNYRALQVLGFCLCLAAAVRLGHGLSRQYRILRFLLATAFLFLVFLRGWQHGGNMWNRILSSGAIVILLMLDLAAALAGQLLPSLFAQIEEVPWLCVPALLTALCSMNTLNRLDLADSQRAGQNVTAVTGQLVPMCRRLLFLMLSAGILTAFLLDRVTWTPQLPEIGILRPLTTIPGSIAAFLSEGVVRLFRWLFRFAEAGEPEPEPSPLPFGTAEEAEVSSVWVPVMQGLYLLLLLTIVLILLIRLVRRLLSGRHGPGRDRNERFDGMFEDRYEPLLRLRDLTGRALETLRKGFGTGEVPWGMLRSERDRVRYLYRRVLLNAEKKGYRKQDSDTPRETLSRIVQSTPHDADSLDALVSLYEQVRYGEEDPPPGSAEKLRHFVEWHRY